MPVALLAYIDSTAHCVAPRTVRVERRNRARVVTIIFRRDSQTSFRHSSQFFIGRISATIASYKIEIVIFVCLHLMLNCNFIFLFNIKGFKTKQNGQRFQ